MAPREREEEGGLEVPIGVHPDCPNPEVIPLDTIDEFPVESVTKRKKVSPLEMILASLIGLVEVVRLEYLPSFGAITETVYGALPPVILTSISPHALFGGS